MRLIDADALRASLRESYERLKLIRDDPNNEERDAAEEEMMDILDTIMRIDKAPTVVLPELVRCKDCAEYTPKPLIEGFDGYCNWHARHTNEEELCSCGVKKD